MDSQKPHSLKSSHLLNNLKLYLTSWSLFTLAIAACSNPLENNHSEISPSPTPNSRADLQVSGLKELVADFNIAPILPENPSLADRGSEHYYQICLACHGDWGQGLTDEWREQWGEDKNCWESKCHASNHPPEGFELPTIIPPVLGVGSIARLTNGEELQTHIAQTMPWWNPGSLSENQAWELTAYLLRERGEMLDDFPLDAGTAPVIQLHVAATPQVDNRPGSFALIGSLTFFTLIFILKKDSKS